MVYRIWGHCFVFMKEIHDTGGASLWLRVSIIDRKLPGRPAAEMLRVICNGLPHLQGRRGGGGKKPGTGRYSRISGRVGNCK